jgi:hypothetical protein
VVSPLSAFEVRRDGFFATDLFSGLDSEPRRGLVLEISLDLRCEDVVPLFLRLSGTFSYFSNSSFGTVLSSLIWSRNESAHDDIDV